MNRGRSLFLKIPFFSIFSILIMNLFISPVQCDEEVTSISFSPEFLSVAPNESFTLLVYCQPYQPIKSYELSISFDENLIQVDSVIEGDFFEGHTTFFNDGTIDNTHGKIEQIYGLIIGQGNVSESGTLVEVSFSAQNSIGSSDISIYNLGITNETQYISVNIENASVAIENICPSIENESILFSNPIDTESSIGWCNVSCDVIDDAVDRVKLVLTYPDHSVSNTSLLTHDNTLFFLNMTSFPHGTYSYYLYVADIHGNMVLSDTYSFEISPNWDVNSDGTINVIDLIRISNNYGQSGSLGWIREDVNNDGIIQLSDLIMVSNYYDSTW